MLYQGSTDGAIWCDGALPNRVLFFHRLVHCPLGSISVGLQSGGNNRGQSFGTTVTKRLLDDVGCPHMKVYNLLLLKR